MEYSGVFCFFFNLKTVKGNIISFWLELMYNVEDVFPPYKKLICNINSISFLLIFESLCIFGYSDNQLTCWPAMQFYCAALLDIRCRLYLCAVLWLKWRNSTGDKTFHLHWTRSHITSLRLRAKWKNSSQSYWHKASVAHVMNRTIHMCPEPNGTDFFSGAVSSLLGTAWPCNRELQEQTRKCPCSECLF